MILFLLLFSFIHQATSYSSFIDPITFSFPAFDASSCAPGGELYCTGGALSSDSGFIHLNPVNDSGPAGVGTVGRVLYPQPVLVWPAVFMTTFTIVISNDANSTDYGDGMTFIMVPEKCPGPTNSQGGFLGLFNHTTKGDNNHQLAVEFDTYMNEFDPDSNHVGIDTKSINSDITGNLNAIGVNLKSGREVKVKIEYDGWSKKFQVFVGYTGNPLIAVINYTIPMSTTVPKYVYIGFTGSVAGRSREGHQILNWGFQSLPLPHYSLMNGSKDNKDKKIMIITIPVVGSCLILLAFLVPIIRKARRPANRRKVKRGDIESKSRNAINGPKLFTFKQLVKATKNFSSENLLGTGGFGSVYKGELSDPPSTIAVKRISATSKQGEREFLAEICTIGRLRHKNIVQLQGWCHESDHLLLVYEFMPNGSLDRFIPNSSLDWCTRHSILTGLASALLYLHEESGQTVIHRDVKPNNVMLDAEFNTHLGDFGLARLLHDETAVTTMLAGTPGYLAPECSYTGKATPESDAFSFGIVVLEVVCGRRSWGGGVGENNLVDYVWGLHGNKELLDGVDPKLEGKFDEEEVKRALVVGLACSHPDPTLRPKMKKVVHVFSNPNEPLMNLSESRPTAIYVPVISPSTSALGSGRTKSSVFTHASFDETTLEYGR